MAEKLIDIILIGAGGLGREVANLIEVLNKHDKQYRLAGFLDNDDRYNEDSRINGYPWLGPHQWAINHVDDYVYTCSINNPTIKGRVQDELEAYGARFHSLIDHSVYIPTSTKVGDGCIFFGGTQISVNCNIGKGVFLNSGVTIGHDTEIGHYSSIMTGAGISGSCKIGQKVNVGGHAFIVPGKKVGDGATVAAGSIVFTNVKAGTTVLGNPAKRMRGIE